MENVDGQTDVGHINLIGGLVTRNPPKNEQMDKQMDGQTNGRKTDKRTHGISPISKGT